MPSAAFVPAASCGASLFCPAVRLAQPRSLRQPLGLSLPQSRSPSTCKLPPFALSAEKVLENAVNAVSDVAGAASEAVSTVQDELQNESLRTDTSSLSLILARVVFFLLIYITIGTVVISWDEWRKSRNEEREIKEFLATRGRKTAGVVREQTGTLNRGSRRMAEKLRKQEERDKKRFNK